MKRVRCLMIGMLILIGTSVWAATVERATDHSQWDQVARIPGSVGKHPLDPLPCARCAEPVDPMP